MRCGRFDDRRLAPQLERHAGAPRRALPRRAGLGPGGRRRGRQHPRRDSRHRSRARRAGPRPGRRSARFVSRTLERRRPVASMERGALRIPGCARARDLAACSCQRWWHADVPRLEKRYRVSARRARGRTRALLRARAPRRIRSRARTGRSRARCSGSLGRGEWREVALSGVRRARPARGGARAVADRRLGGSAARHHARPPGEPEARADRNRLALGARRRAGVPGARARASRST